MNNDVKTNNKNELYDFLKIPDGDFINGHFSCFTKGLMYAREATGRNSKTGQSQEYAKHLNISGALGYFALLEQIGNCLKPKSSLIYDTHQNNIHKALHYFSTLSNDDIFVIRALRNTFSHDFSLYGTKKSTNKNLLHHFKLVFSDTEPLLLLRTAEWDGELNTKNENNRTVVNLEKLCNLIDKICADVQEMAKENELEIVLKGGFKEYYDRYSINIRLNVQLIESSETEIKIIQVKKE
ncbi:MAG: hypothetical protein P9M05_06925 [Candidatus Stygibacter australis]|nr:hypothetical protein [Candidatus Stygibacter australis]